MKHQIYTTLLCAIIILPMGLLAQDASFTQQFANPLRLNSALMGSNTDLKVIANYRTQWGIIGKGYNTASVSVLFPLFLKPDLWKMGEGKTKLDFGLNVINDRAGAFNTLDVLLAVGYGVKLSESHFLTMTLNGGYVQKSLDASGLTYDEQYVNGSYSVSNPAGGNIFSQKAGYPDAGFGAMWDYLPEKGKIGAYAGISGYHLNQPDETFATSGNSRLSGRVSYQAGLKVPGNDKVSFAPNVIVNTQNGTKQLMIGTLVDYKIGESGKAVVGAWYREKEAIAFQVGYEHKMFLFGYSYDFGHAEINKSIARLMTHEIAIAYKLNRMGNATSVSYN